jgi:hypothetical protein
VSDFQPGEIVDITIKGVRVEWVNSTDMNVWATDEVDTDTGVNLGERITISHVAPNITVTRVAPVDWPPRVDDLWRDSLGNVWFATAARQGRPMLTNRHGTSSDANQVNQAYGLMVLVHREESQP